MNTVLGVSMPMLEWNDNFLLGVNELDEHHKYLVDLMNRSYGLFKSKAPHARLEMILEELSRYTDYHFAAEEKWMRKHRYPKLDEHVAEHDCFMQKLAAFKDDFHTGKASLKAQIFAFLTDWVVTHILDTDYEYGRFIAEEAHCPCITPCRVESQPHPVSCSGYTPPPSAPVRRQPPAPS